MENIFENQDMRKENKETQKETSNTSPLPFFNQMNTQDKSNDDLGIAE